MIRFCNLFLLILITSLTFAQKVISYEISVDFFPENATMYNIPVNPQNYMRSNAKIKLEPTSKNELDFYLHGELTVDSILVDNKKIDYDSEKIFYYYDYSLIAKKITIAKKEIADLSHLDVYYSGFFTPSRTRSLSDFMRIDEREGVYLRSFGYSLWFPILIDDGGESYEAKFNKINVTIPKDFKVIVVGELVNESVNGNYITSTWLPGEIDISDMQCAARRYKEINEDEIYIYYVNESADINGMLDFIIKLKALYSNNLRYVSESKPIYLIEMPKYGDISSENVVGISENNFKLFKENVHSKLTIAHEMVHPYVAIPISPDNEFYAFVVEGFPSFFQVYALQRIGDESFNLEKKVSEVKESYIKKRSTGTNRRGYKLPSQKPILEISADDIGSYKDTFVLNDRVWLFFYDLWEKMGDDNFDSFLKELFKLDQIHYEKFNKLIVKFLPNYETKLYKWLKTNEYPVN